MPPACYREHAGGMSTTLDSVRHLEDEFAAAMTQMYAVGNHLARLRRTLADEQPATAASSPASRQAGSGGPRAGDPRYSGHVSFADHRRRGAAARPRIYVCAPIDLSGRDEGVRRNGFRPHRK